MAVGDWLPYLAGTIRNVFKIGKATVDTSAISTAKTLSVAANGNYLVTVNGNFTVAGTASVSGTNTGDQGPGSSTDNAIVRFDGTGGKTFQNSGVTINDTNAVDFPSTILVPTLGIHVGTSSNYLSIGWQGSTSKALTFDANGNYVLTFNGTLTVSAAATISGTNTGDQLMDLIILRDEKSQNTHGGTATLGAWRTRDIAEISDTGGHCSVSSNQITLAAGTYEIIAFAPCVQTGYSQARLYNISDSTVAVVGTDVYAYNSSGLSAIIGKFTIASTKTFEIQMQVGTTVSTYGFGLATNYGTEVYTIAKLRKVG